MSIILLRRVPVEGGKYFTSVIGAIMPYETVADKARARRRLQKFRAFPEPKKRGYQFALAIIEMPQADEFA